MRFEELGARCEFQDSRLKFAVPSGQFSVNSFQLAGGG